MSTVQDTLTTVVELGWYGGAEYRSEFMCVALLHAAFRGTINLQQCVEATEAVVEYMHSLCPYAAVLNRALHSAGLTEVPGAKEWAPVLGKEFYLNWDTRPGVPE